MSINLTEKYVGLLDEKYKKEAITAGLDAPQGLFRESMSAKTIFIPSVELSGLGNYSRTTGFQEGNVSVNWESHEFTQDRGTQFEIDEADNMETIDVAFGRASGEFIRTQVAPEIDAYRFSEMSAKAGTTVTEDIDENNVLIEIDSALEVMDNAEVPDADRKLYVNPSVFRALKNADAITRNVQVDQATGSVQRAVYDLDGMVVEKVPNTRFNTEIDLLDIDGTDDGGFDLVGDTIEFMIVHKDAVLPIVKLDGLRVFNPQTNQNSRGWLFDYRVYHDIFVPQNKTDGIFVCVEDTA